ncbi:hypothetical protein GpartN1_g5571.t1 [Galdieria partita]|uniref:Uncharacterized protein n=1 Tax=Galdieria partita TaxID=83374 RepID=A0A9C7UST7_9RHOD|nr:hypothetical protein GpartN1_g5571.t1 [Galdieria partita]
MDKQKSRRFLAETKRTWREKLRKHKAKKPFAITFENLSEKDKEILRQWNLKPLEQVTVTELKRCTRAELHTYCGIYGILRKRSDIVIEELIQRKNFFTLAKQAEEIQQQEQDSVASGFEESDWKLVAFHSPFELFLQSSKRKKLGTQPCTDLSNILYLAFELFQTGRSYVVSCLLALFLRKTKTSSKRYGLNREITALSCKALFYKRPHELARLLSRILQFENFEKTFSLQDLGEIPSSMALYGKRSLLVLEQGKVVALSQLVFLRWYLRDYLSAISDISGHIQQFPYARYPIFYILLAAFFCLEAYRELGIDEELTMETDIRGNEDYALETGLGYVFPFNFLHCWNYLPEFARDSSTEKDFAVEYFEKALNCLERCAEYETAPNIIVILKSIVLAHCRDINEALLCMEEFIEEKARFDSFLLENYLLCLETYQTMLSSSDTAAQESVFRKRVLTAQHLLLEVNPFSSIAFTCLTVGLEKRLSTVQEILLAVAHQLDCLGNMSSQFLFYFDFWKNSFQHAWRRFAELLNICEDSEVESVWKERQRFLWWPSRFFSYSSLKEDQEHYPDVIPYKTFCVRKLMGTSSEYDYFQERENVN